MRFAAPWDRTLWIVTAATTAGLAVGAALLVRLAVSTEVPLATATGIGLALVLAATLGAAFAGGPRGYTIERAHLRIERPLRSVAIPLASIRAAGPLSDDAVAGSIRIAGSAGLFGYYGRFWSKRLGAYRLFATRRTGLAVVDTADERYVLSPEPLDRFVEVLRQRVPSAAPKIPAAPLAPRPVPRSVKRGIGALVAAIPLVAGAIVGGVWAFTPTGARVADGEIRIERRLAPAVVIPASEVRRVDRIPAAQGARLGRVAGTSVPGGVRYGHFRSRELGDVSLYAWRRDDTYVLLETGDGRIVVTPDDPDGFVAAVRAAQPR